MSLKQTVATVYNYRLFSLIPPLNLMMHIKMGGVNRSTYLLKIAAAQNELPQYQIIRSAISHARNHRIFVLEKKPCSIMKHESSNDPFELCFIRLVCSCQLHFHANAQHVGNHQILETYSSIVTFLISIPVHVQRCI